MFNKQIKCQLLSDLNANKIVKFHKEPRNFKFIPWREIHRKTFKSNENKDK